MKVETKNNIIVIVTVLVLIAIGATLFYLKGSKLAMIFSVIGIPVLFIVYSSLYIKKQKSTRRDPSLILKKGEIEKIVYEYKDLTNKIKRAHDEYGIDSADIESNLEDLTKENFADIGIFVEDIEGTKNITYDDEQIAKNDVENLDSVINDLHVISDKFKEQVKNHTSSFSGQLVSLLNDLKNSGFDIDHKISDLQNSIDNHDQSNDFLENTMFMDRLISSFNSAIESCIQDIDKLKGTVEELNKDISFVNQDLSRVRDSMDQHDFTTSTSILKNIMEQLESSASGDFNETKVESLNAINTVLDSIGDFEDESLDQLRELHNKISVIVSSSKMLELRQLQKQIIPFSNKTIKGLNEKILLNEKKISEANPPSDFYFSNSSSYQPELEGLLLEQELPAYKEKISNLLQRMMPVYDLSQEKAKVIVAYGKIEKKIQKQLDKNGFVGLNDIRIKNAEQFLRLFALNHPDITYDNLKNTLEFVGGRPIHKLNVTVIENKNKSPLNGIKLKLKKGSGVIGTMETDAQGSAVFEDVLIGEYSVIVEKSGDYNEITKKISVKGDTSLEITMKKPSMGERICQDKEDNMRKTLSRFTSELQQEMKENKFITSDFSLKIKSEFIPCLLYVWSKENNGIKFIELGENRYMAYDANVAQKELENIISGMEPGDREDIDDLRDGFFSAPLPNDEIFDLIEKLKKESNFYENVNFDNKFIWI